MLGKCGRRLQTGSSPCDPERGQTWGWKGGKELGVELSGRRLPKTSEEPSVAAVGLVMGSGDGAEGLPWQPREGKGRCVVVENKEHGCSWKKELLEPCPRQSASVDAGHLRRVMSGKLWNPPDCVGEAYLAVVCGPGLAEGGSPC